VGMVWVRHRCLPVAGSQPSMKPRVPNSAPEMPVKTTPSATSGGAEHAPTTTTGSPAQEWIYGPQDDPKINPDGSTKPKTWTTPDVYPDRQTATDKLDPFKPAEGRRRVTIPEGTDVQRGKTPGRQGPYNGGGGANETLVPGGLPPGSAGSWERLPP
jgi:hypothetical protein